MQHLHFGEQKLSGRGEGIGSGDNLDIPGPVDFSRTLIQGTELISQMLSNILMYLTLKLNFNGYENRL